MSNVITVNTIEDIVLDKNLKIESIIHISDIHIKRDNSREEEYDKVFEGLYNYIVKQKNKDNVIVVITGDVIDATTEPYSIKKAKELIIGICKHVPCIVIPGNHDVLINKGMTELDKLSPILYELKTDKPFYLLTNDGYYHFKNVTFGYTSIYSNKILKKKNNNKQNIALYHGRIKEVMDIEDKYTNSSLFSTEDFRGYDIVLLGDIHKRQDIKNELNIPILYAGSLIQQDSMEDYVKGGYLISLKKSQYEEFDIESGMANIIITIDKDGKCDTDLSKLPKNIKTKFINKTLDDIHIDNVKKILKENNITIKESSIVHSLDGNINTEIEIENKKYDLSRIRNKKNIYEIVEKFVKNNAQDQNNIEKIMKRLNKVLNDKSLELNDKLDIHTNKREIKLKYVEYNNISCYGEMNAINFEELSKHPVIGLCGPNDIGKSTVLEIIVLALSGKMLKGGNKPDIINRNKKTANIYLKIQVNNELFSIERIYNKQSEKKATELVKINKLKPGKEDLPDNYEEVFKILEKEEKEKGDQEDSDEDDNSNEVNYSKENKSTNVNMSNKFIEQNICSMKDLLLTSIIKQTRDESFLSAKDRFSLLLKYSGIGVFDEIKVLCKKYKTAKAQEKGRIKAQIAAHNELKKYIIKDKSGKKEKDNFDYLQYTKDYEDAINELTSNLKKTENKIDNLLKEIISKEKEISLMNGQLKSMKECDYDEDTVKENIDKNKKEKKEINKLIEKYKENIEENKNKINKLDKKLKKYENIEEEKEDFDKNKEKTIKEKKSEIIKLRKEIKNDNNIKFDNNECLNKISFSKSKIEEKDKDINKYKHKLELFTMNGIIKTYEEYIIHSKNKLIEEIKKLLVKDKIKQNIISKLDEYIGDINNKNIEDDYDDIHCEEDINKSYNESLTKLKENTNQKEKYEIELKNYENRINNIKVIEKIEKYEKEIEEEEEKEFKKWSEYSELKEEKMGMVEQQKNEEMKIKELEIKKEKIEMLLEKEKDKLESIKNNTKDLKLIEEYKNKIEKIKKEIDSKTKEKDQQQKEKNEINKKINDKNILNAQVSNHVENYKTLEDDTSSYESLQNIFNNHIINGLLKDKIIPKLTEVVNKILNCIGYENIVIELEEKHKDIKIIRKDSKTLVTRSGGFYYNLYDLVFRIGMSQINQFIHQDFLIIDEIMDSASDLNKKNIVKLFDYLKEYYKYVILITHDEYIKEFINFNLKIERKEGESKILYKKINIRKEEFEQSKKKLKKEND